MKGYRRVHCIILLFMFGTFQHPMLGKRNLMGNFSGKGLVFQALWGCRFDWAAQPPLSALTMQLGPCSPFWHYLAVGPILIPALSPQVCPSGSCKAPSLLRMTKKVNPISHHLSWPLLIFFLYCIFFSFSLLCPELCDVNVAPLSVLLTEVRLVDGQTGIWQLFIPLWVLSFGPLRLL